ncbi:MAG: mRNA surveillance protein pelota [Thermoplasmata archaeon]|nr:mRNA surveillance protein pelota [Thermoplasmata archaeon]
MRLIHEDRKTGLLKLRLETPSDLWRISRIIQPGDLVGSSTTRRDPEAPEDAPAAQRDRRRVWLVVRVEAVEFHGFSKHVRVTGPIVEGPFDIGRHHTLDLEERSDITVQKPQVSASDRALLDEGMRREGEATILLAAVDWGESTIARARGRVVDAVADVNRTLAGKQFGGEQGDKDRRKYIDELVGLLAREGERADAIVLAGPGFLKEAVAKALGEGAPKMAAKIHVFSASAGGRVGVDELLRSGRASEVLATSVAAEEVALVERLMEAVAGGRRAAVGPGEAREAGEAGAIQVLLVGDGKLRDPAVIPIVDGARQNRARVVVVRDEGDAGKRLASLGGVAALLRYDWTPAVARASRGAPGPLPEGPRSGA